MLHWMSLAVLVAGLLSIGPAGIRAQGSTVVCPSSFDWMLNSKNQNPCVVAAYLSAVCTDGQYTITPLPAGYYYSGPYLDQVNPCQCNTITYNLVSACGFCQNGTIISWPTWDFNCTLIWSEIYPYTIPEDTAVPYWAYQTVTPTGTFNVTLAQFVGDKPEATATGAATSTDAATSTSPSVITTPTSSSTLPTGSSPKTNVGAIAGGVVGGVVVAVIAAVVVFFFMKKQRSQIPVPAQFVGHPPPMNPSNGYAPQPATPTSPYSSQMTQSKLYDPSDPSTFPVSPPPPTTTTGSSSNFPTSFVTYSNNPSLRPGAGGAYTGAPEV